MKSIWLIFFSDFQVGKLTFTVEQGDILSKRCDAIVNGSNDDLDLTKGKIKQMCLHILYIILSPNVPVIMSLVITAWTV